MVEACCKLFTYNKKRSGPKMIFVVCFEMFSIFKITFKPTEINSFYSKESKFF